MRRSDLTHAIDRELMVQALRQDGPLVDVTVHATCRDGSACPPVRGRGLIDTGADRSAVAVQSLDPRAQPTGTYQAQGVTSDAVDLPIFPLRVELGDGYDVTLDHVAATPHLKSQGLAMLIGRDLLQQDGVHLAYDGPRGEYTLTTPRSSTTVVSSTSRTPLAAAGVALALGALAAWLLIPPSCPVPST